MVCRCLDLTSRSFRNWATRSGSWESSNQHAVRSVPHTDKGHSEAVTSNTHSKTVERATILELQEKTMHADLLNGWWYLRACALCLKMTLLLRSYNVTAQNDLNAGWHSMHGAHCAGHCGEECGLQMSERWRLKGPMRTASKPRKCFGRGSRPPLIATFLNLTYHQALCLGTRTVFPGIPVELCAADGWPSALCSALETTRAHHGTRV